MVVFYYHPQLDVDFFDLKIISYSYLFNLNLYLSGNLLILLLGFKPNVSSNRLFILYSFILCFIFYTLLYFFNKKHLLFLLFTNKIKRYQLRYLVIFKLAEQEVRCPIPHQHYQRNNRTLTFVFKYIMRSIWMCK